MVTPLAVFKLILLVIAVPFMVGLVLDGIFSKEESGDVSYKFMISRCMVFGFCAELAIFQIVAVPFIIKRAPFHLLKNVFLIVTVVITLISIVLNLRNIKKRFINKFNEIKKMNLNIYLWIAIIGMIAFQTQLLSTNMHMDTDDSRFIAEALEACEKDTMLQVNCITGEHYDTFVGELRKEVAAPYPFFIAALSSLTEIHPAVLAHMIFPIFLIPLFYMCMYMLGRFFFSDSLNRLPLYMLLLSVIVLFSFESRFSWGYTLLTIIWQGRSIACLILIPAYFYTLSYIFSTENVKPGIYLTQFLIALACGNSSGMASMMVASVTGFFCLLLLFGNVFIKNDKKKFAECIKRAMLTLIGSCPAFLFVSLLFLLKM